MGEVFFLGGKPKVMFEKSPPQQLAGTGEEKRVRG